jgi:phage tail-like protein
MLPVDRDAPFNQYKFVVKWDGRTIRVGSVSPLRRSTEVIEFREGNDPNGATRQVPGRTKYDAIVLKRGRGHDTEFEEWANLLLGSGTSLTKFRKDITIELQNGSGQVVLAYKVYRCWPIEYVAMSELDATISGVVIESLTLENEGWEQVQTRKPSKPKPKSQ